MDGFGDSLCLRLYYEYDTINQLVLNIMNGQGGVQVENFVLTLSFDFLGLKILQNAPPCPPNGKKRDEVDQTIFYSEYQQTKQFQWTPSLGIPQITNLKVN